MKTILDWQEEMEFKLERVDLWEKYGYILPDKYIRQSIGEHEVRI